MILAGTGHRPQKWLGWGVEADLRRRRLAHLVLDQERPEVVISGMALGWDTALAIAALERGLELWAALPFTGQEARWAPELQAQYHCILELADRVEVVSSGGYAAWKMHERNGWMVDHCTKLAAVWDGSPGGTAACIAYAESKRKPWTNYWGATFDA